MTDHDRITLVGLLLEAALGIQREFAPSVEESIGVGGQAFEICVRLARSTGATMRMSDLATQSGISPSGLTRAIDRLVATGLVRRESCPSDRRGSFAILTDAGRHTMQCAIERHRAQLDELFDGLLSHEEERSLGELLERLRNRVLNPGAALVC